MTEQNNRRDVATRKVPFFQNLAKQLVSLGLAPNQVSILSSVFAMLGAFAIYKSSQATGTITLIWLIVGLVGIQLRLICNLIDGLMAVEGGLKTASGELFNDVPDRVSDIVLILAVALAAQNISAYMLHLGWFAALLAVMTAYIRTLGASMTGAHDFSGVMAKQHRMFLLNLACIGAALEIFLSWPRGYAFSFAVVVIGIGSFITCVQRLVKIYKKLES